MRKTVISLVAATALAAPAVAATDWTYTGDTGADRWGQLHQDFELCERGIMQSPIDLGQANATGEVEVDVMWQPGLQSLVHNGHTLQANFAPGSAMMSGGKTFNLVQVHFHTPSEHTVDGEHYPLTAHFVHASDAGELAVLGVMFEEGAANAELQKLIDAAPPAHTETMDFDAAGFNPAAMLPGDAEDIAVYRYMGSLTTPPCSEGVNWHVIPAPVSASAEQIAAMETAMGMTARPVQLLNGRLLVAPE